MICIAEEAGTILIRAMGLLSKQSPVPSVFRWQHVDSGYVRVSRTSLVISIYVSDQYTFALLQK